MVSKPSGQYGVQVTWLWRAAFKLVSPEGKIVFIDPWLRENPGCPPEYKNIDQLHADVILFTHSHGDHLGDTVDLVKKTGAKLVAIVDLVQALKEEGLTQDQMVRLSYGGTGHAHGISASMVPAWHTTPSSVGFVIGFSSGFNVYHSGDTCLFSDMSLIKELYEPQLALLPVGGTFTMDDYAASIACKKYLQPKYVIPMHYPAGYLDTSPSDCAERFRRHMQGSSTEVIITRPGETITF